MTKVSHMVLPVADVHKSRDWYVDKLGFTLEREREQAVGIKDQSGLTIFLQKTADSLGDKKSRSQFRWTTSTASIKNLQASA